jgi:hypothetical protein
VRVSPANGAEELAVLSSGYCLAWLHVPAGVREVDALEGNGHMLQRLRDPNGSLVASWAT